jgi:hypothetical protein
MHAFIVKSRLTAFVRVDLLNKTVTVELAVDAKTTVFDLKQQIQSHFDGIKWGAFWRHHGIATRSGSVLTRDWQRVFDVVQPFEAVTLARRKPYPSCRQSAPQSFCST